MISIRRFLPSPFVIMPLFDVEMTARDSTFLRGNNKPLRNAVHSSQQRLVARLYEPWEMFDVGAGHNFATLIKTGGFNWKDMIFLFTKNISLILRDTIFGLYNFQGPCSKYIYTLCRP